MRHTTTEVATVMAGLGFDPEVAGRVQTLLEEHADHLAALAIPPIAGGAMSTTSGGLDLTAETTAARTASEECLAALVEGLRSYRDALGAFAGRLARVDDAAAEDQHRARTRLEAGLACTESPALGPAPSTCTAGGA